VHETDAAAHRCRAAANFTTEYQRGLRSRQSGHSFPNRREIAFDPIRQRTTGRAPSIRSPSARMSVTFGGPASSL
jgi:hypothetical protein